MIPDGTGDNGEDEDKEEGGVAMIIPSETRLYKPLPPYRSAVARVEPSHSKPEESLIRVTLGRGTLVRESIYGPFPKSELAARHAELMADLKGQGYGPPGRIDSLTDLRGADPAKRGRAALRLGWRRDVEAVDDLLAALPPAVDDVCGILDALGMIGDARAIPAVRPYIERKLLSRRRSAVEALRMLGDSEGLELAAALAKERLPDSIVDVLNDSAKIAEALKGLPLNERGPAFDALYELATPETVSAVLEVLKTTVFGQPHIWRNVKSLIKRAMLRHDYPTLGWLCHEVERQGRLTSGIRAKVKSGYDGQQRETRIFSRFTQNYIRRQSWRFLRTLARWRPRSYSRAAAEMLIAYVPEDAQKAIGTQNPYRHGYVLNRILYGQSPHWRFDSRKPACRFVSDAAAQKFFKGQGPARQEAYPWLWEMEPRPYLRLLAKSRLMEVHTFAYRAVSGESRPVLKAASWDELADMLNGPFSSSINLALAELRDRYDPAQPAFWDALRRLAALTLPAARELLLSWVRRSADLWRADADLAFDLLTSPNAEVRGLAADLVIESPPSPTVRQALAQRLIAWVRNGTADADRLDAICRAARHGFVEEIEADFTLNDILQWIADPAAPAQALGGALLGRRPQAYREMGLERLAALAEHQVAAVREAARGLIRTGLAELQRDPSLLFVLADSDWEDNRRFALELLRDEVKLETLGFDGLFGLLDSGRSDARELGRDLARQSFERWPARDFLDRLIEHPNREMRPFALELAERHLPDGPHALEQAAGLFRAGLLDLQPSRSLKDRLLALLQKRGLSSRDEAAVAARLLSDFARLRSRRDREPALEALTRLQLAFPDLTEGVVLRPSAIVAAKPPMSAPLKSKLPSQAPANSAGGDWADFA